MEPQDFMDMYEQADSVSGLFELVKEAVRLTLNRERSGLMLGLSDLGISPHGFVGGFHQMGSNAIVLNRSVLKRIARAKPGMLKPYAFSILLHEYLHTLGVVDEARTRALTLGICSEILGEDHPATELSRNFGKATRDIFRGRPEQPGSFDITFIEGIDPRETDYIG